MHFKVLINPKRIERSRIKTGQEHIYNDQKIQFLILHPERHIFIIILELLARCVIVRMEHHVVIIYRAIKEIPCILIKRGGILRVLLIKDTVCFFLIRRIAVDNSNLKLLRRISLHDLAELFIIQLCHRDRCNCKDGIES